MWSGGGYPIFHALWPETPVIRQRLSKLLRNPAPDVLNGGKNISKKNARGELLFRRNLPH